MNAALKDLDVGGLLPDSYLHLINENDADQGAHV